MSGHTFRPDTRNEALGQAHPDYPHLVYMSMLIGDSGSFSGYVPRDVSALVEAAPELLELLVELTDIEGPQPGHIEWANKVKAAIAKAIHIPADESSAS